MTIEDLKRLYFESLGLMGTINEMEYQFYQMLLAGGVPGTVSTTGNQTIAGVKTFSSPPVVPTPVGNTNAANKAYVDGRLSANQRTAINALTGASTATDIVNALKAA